MHRTATGSISLLLTLVECKQLWLITIKNIARKNLSENDIINLLFDSDNEEIESINEINSTISHDARESISNYSESDSESDNELGMELPNKRRKLLTCKRPVRSVDTSLDEHNYDLLDPNKIKKESYTSTLQKKTKSTKEINVSWTSEKPTNSGRQSAENIIKTKGGPINGSNSATSHQEAWRLFMTDEMLEKLVEYTNYQINKTISKLDKVAIEKYSCYIKPTSVEELTAFIGLLYARGLLQMSNQRYSYLFHEFIGHPVFGATMSCRRFAFLNSNIRFDNVDTRQERFPQDRFTAMRDLFEEFNNRCSLVLQPDDFLAIDETLYGCRNQISFKQYNSSKPQKYGLLFKSVNAVSYPFTFRTSVYSGKPTGNPGPYYITGITPTVKSLVNQLSIYVDLDGRNITMDRLYTSYELFQWLLEKKITAVGTIKNNRKCIPNEIKSVNERNDNSYKCFWDDKGKTTLHSYVVRTKSKGLKNVLALSSMPPILGTTRDDKRKPAILKIYDFSKGGTDIVDQRITMYSVNTKSRRWTMAAFAYILDTIRVNAQTLFSINANIDPRKTNSFSFGWELVQQLVKPHIVSRKANITTLPNSTKRKMCGVLNESSRPNENQKDEIYPKTCDKKRHCHFCLENIKGPGFSQNIKKLSNLKNQCEKCGRCVCKDHYNQFCIECKP